MKNFFILARINQIKETKAFIWMMNEFPLLLLTFERVTFPVPSVIIRATHDMWKGKQKAMNHGIDNCFLILIECKLPRSLFFACRNQKFVLNNARSELFTIIYIFRPRSPGNASLGVRRWSNWHVQQKPQATKILREAKKNDRALTELLLACWTKSNDADFWIEHKFLIKSMCGHWRK